MLSIDKRKLEDLVWCALTSGASRLYWARGYLICTEVHEDAFKHELERGEFPINQLCYSKLEKYTRILELERGSRIPLVNVEGMRAFESILAIIERKENEERESRD